MFNQLTKSVHSMLTVLFNYCSKQRDCFLNLTPVKMALQLAVFDQSLQWNALNQSKVSAYSGWLKCRKPKWLLSINKKTHKGKNWSKHSTSSSRSQIVVTLLRSVAVITVEPAVNYPFVKKGTQTSQASGSILWDRRHNDPLASFACQNRW